MRLFTVAAAVGADDDIIMYVGTYQNAQNPITGNGYDMGSVSVCTGTCPYR
jgi:hypothetical protein